jgi:hypothetical protein
VGLLLRDSRFYSAPGSAVGYLAGRRLSYTIGLGDVLLSFCHLKAGCFPTAQVLCPSHLILRKCSHLGTALPAHPRNYRLLMSTYARRRLFEGEDCAVLFPILSACHLMRSSPPPFPSCPFSFSPFLLFFFRGGSGMRLLCFSRGGHQFFWPWNCL